MAYIDGPMIDKVLIKGVLHPIADNRIEGTNFAYVQIAGDVVVDTPLTAEQLEHITPAVLSEDGAVFNIPALGTILIPKDVVIQDPAPAEDYKVVYTSSPLEGKVYNLEVTIDHTTSEPKEAVVVEGEVATPPVNIAKTDLEAIKATTPDPTSHIIISDEAKALGQEAVDKKANIIVETDADGHPIDVYHAVESPEPDKYYRYQDAELHCIDIYFTKDAAGVVTVDGLLFPDQENIYVEKAKEYMEISTTQGSVIYKSVQPVMVEEHVLGFEEVEAATQTQGTAGIIHYPKSVLFTSPAAFELRFELLEEASYTPTTKFELSKDGLTWTEATWSSGFTLQGDTFNNELGKYAIFMRGDDHFNDTVNERFCGFVCNSGSGIKVSGILNSLWGSKPIQEKECNGLFSFMTGLIDAGDLLFPNDVATSCYKNMFLESEVIKAPMLPATTMAPSCYQDMFRSCSLLTKAPALPATTLATSCYAGMFYRCTALVNAPALPALTAANKCYYQMFQDCTGLVSGPAVLPATTLDGYCYQEMFKGCTSLVNAPSLPAMDIKGASYSSMFEGCTALVTAPALPATTLDATGQNYQAMFSGCTALAKAPELPATTLALQCYLEMFKGCTTLTEPVFFPEIATGGMKNRAMESMFEGCTGITWATAGKEYKIAVGGGVSGDTNTQKMFLNNSGNLPETTGTPKINTVYYLKTTNAAIEVHGLLFSSPNEFKMSLNRMPPSGSVMSYSTDGENYTDITGTDVVITAKPFKVANGEQYHIVFKSTGKVCTDLWTNQPLFIQNEGGSLTVSGKLEEFIPTGNAPSSCEGMFKGLTNLVSAKDLEMFSDATVKCCKSMFYGCTNLTTPPALPATTMYANCYEMMFYDCTSLASAPALPAMTLATSCYDNMFYNCSALTTPPALPAETMESYCYHGMFGGCTSLASAPALPAMTLATSCYSQMFYSCTSLTTPPALPATTVRTKCYLSMFEASGITTPPALPATIMQEECYKYMFNKCASLTSAPELSAMTLEFGCYSSMFAECTSLTTPPALPATGLAINCYSGMFTKSGLTTAPALPATTVIAQAYDSMFAKCTALTAAPDLLATTLGNMCYQHMFSGCTALTAPAAFPTEFVSISESGGMGTSGVMYQMYYECSNIKWSGSGTNTFKISIPSASFGTDQTMQMFKKTYGYAGMFGSEGSPTINMSYTYN